MPTELIPILALVVMFLAATVLPVNMGALGFVAAFAVGTLAVGMDADQIIGGFPSSLFLTLVGITYLFAIAQNNGTVDLLVRGAVRLVGGRVALIPWVMFGITAVLTSIGALGPAAVAIVAPIALGFAARYQINALLMGMMVIHGAQAGGFSPDQHLWRHRQHHCRGCRSQQQPSDPLPRQLLLQRSHRRGPVFGSRWPSPHRTQRPRR